MGTIREVQQMVTRNLSPFKSHWLWDSILISYCKNSHLSQKNFRGVKIFHLLFGAIRLLEYILLIIEQIAWVSRWFVLKNTYCQNVFVTESHGVYYFTTFVSSPVPLQGKTGHYIELCWHDTIDEWYCLLIQFVTFWK